VDEPKFQLSQPPALFARITFRFEISGETTTVGTRTPSCLKSKPKSPADASGAGTPFGGTT